MKLRRTAKTTTSPSKLRRVPVGARPQKAQEPQPEPAESKQPEEDLPEHYLIGGVEQIEGEVLRFHVQSRSRRVKHMVDLMPFAFNGRCSCEHFEGKLLKKLNDGAIPSEKLRCWHIQQARSYFCDWVLPRFAKSLGVAK
jgi:hypothetical protein